MNHSDLSSQVPVNHSVFTDVSTQVPVDHFAFSDLSTHDRPSKKEKLS